MTTLAPEERRVQRHGLVLAALHSAWLEHLERSGFADIETRRNLPPIKRLWCAWRAARRG